MSSLKFLFIFLIISGFAFATPALAVSPNSILVDLVPASPKPNSNVTINLRSFAANLDTVNISWSVNNTVSASGIGRKSISLTTGNAGSSTTVVAKILLPDGEIEKRILIQPAEMVMLWQANDSYVPPFYKGKALPMASSEIKVVAVPEVESNGRTVDPKKMSYYWKKNYTNQQASSGYGKDSFKYINDYLDDSNTISVTAQSPTGGSASEGTVTIEVTEPQVVFYKEDPVFGTIWEHALPGSYKISQEEVIFAAPYFMSPKELIRPDILWSWSINDAPVTVSGYAQNIIPLKTVSGISGVSKLKLDIENRYNIFKTASKEINIQY